MRKNVHAHFSLVTLCVFHVKPYEASEAATNIFVAISEPIKVGLWQSQKSQHISTLLFKNF